MAPTYRVSTLAVLAAVLVAVVAESTSSHYLAWEGRAAPITPTTTPPTTILHIPHTTATTAHPPPTTTTTAHLTHTRTATIALRIPRHRRIILTPTTTIPIPTLLPTEMDTDTTTKSNLTTMEPTLLQDQDGAVKVTTTMLTSSAVQTIIIITTVLHLLLLLVLLVSKKLKAICH